MSLNNIVQAILTTLCIIICLIPFAVYIIFSKYISIKDQPRYSSDIQKGKLNISLNVLIFPILFELISLIDSYILVYYDIVKLLIYSAILFVIFVLILLACTKEYKKEKSVLVVIILVCLFLSPAVVHKVNTSYDFSSPQEIYCQIIDKSTWTNNKNETTYYLTFNYKAKNIKTEVDKETYIQYNIEDDIAVIRKQGFIGIERLILSE